MSEKITGKKWNSSTKIDSSGESGKIVNKKERHILIVEDDKVNILYLKELIETVELSGFEIHVHHVFTGERAVDFCRRNTVHLVLMDIKLPGIDGFEAARMIKSIDSHVVVIAQTAYALSGEHQRALDAGCNDYISKPILMEEFTEKLQLYL
jgi:two-component system sensor histidine kinase EvgS